LRRETTEQQQKTVFTPAIAAPPVAETPSVAVPVEPKKEEAKAKPAPLVTPERVVTAPPAKEPPPSAPQVQNEPIKPKQEAKPKRGKKTPVPFEPPPLSANATKEERLADLLRKYKADQITAEDYHKQRAAILAAP
jgi:hypothetical protein